MKKLKCFTYLLYSILFESAMSMHFRHPRSHKRMNSLISVRDLVTMDGKNFIAIFSSIISRGEKKDFISNYENMLEKNLFNKLIIFMIFFLEFSNNVTEGISNVTSQPLYQTTTTIPKDTTGI